MLPPALARGDVKKRSSEVQLRLELAILGDTLRRAVSAYPLSRLPLSVPAVQRPPSLLTGHRSQGTMVEGVPTSLWLSRFHVLRMFDGRPLRHTRVLRTIFRTPAAPSFPPSFSSGRGWTAGYGQPGLMTRQGSVERKCRHDTFLFGSTSGDPGRIQCRRFACAGFQGRENVRSGPSAPRVDREQSSGPSCNLTRRERGKRESERKIPAISFDPPFVLTCLLMASFWSISPTPLPLVNLFLPSSLSCR